MRRPPRPAPRHGEPPAPVVPGIAGAVAIAAAFSASAFLFLIELLAGKMLLPRFGGAPGVWVSCLAFFQVALVAAYILADRLIRSGSPRMQVLAQAVLFVAAAVVTALGLSLAGEPDWLRSSLPLPLAVLATLSLTAGAAFFAVATLAPLFGHWRTLWPDAGSGDASRAYSLYAAGNAGSFAVLVGYPLVIEPLAGLERQAALATRLYVAVAALAVVCGWFAATQSRRTAATGSVPEEACSDGSDRWRQWLRWGALAAVPASWLASVTTHATVEVAPIPLLWIVPLGLYLASFVLVFSPPGRRWRRFEPPALLAAIAAAAWLLAGDVSEPVWPVIAVHLAAFFVACVALHGMLVDERPPVGRLSEFYLVMAVGGACGGLGNALLAPALFDAHHEFPLAIAAAAGLLPGCWRGVPGRRRFLIPAAAAALLGGVLTAAPWLAVPRPVWLVIVAGAVAAILLALGGRERAFGLAALLSWLFFVGEASHHVVHRVRTFFGVLRVCESDNGPSRHLMHGGIRHGTQLVSPDRARRLIPLSYYNDAGPLGSIFAGFAATAPSGRVAVAGLGVGTIASYARPGQEFVFFEIDPEVVRIARDPRWFSFLADCDGAVRVVVDDARLALDREPDGSLALLVIDAFTGDSVPAHLLTAEAFELYGRKLTPDGILALHVSNQYLDFVPVVEAAAAAGGWMGVQARDADVPAEQARSPSEWIALSRSLGTVKAIYARPTSDRWRWRPIAETPRRRPWTDDRTAIAEALRP